MNSRSYPVILTFAFAALLVFISVSLYPKEEASVMTFAEVESLGLPEEYPQNPYALMSAYNKIMLGLYSGNLSEGEIREALRLQRSLFTAELLDLNSYESQYAEITAELGSFEQSGNFIREITIEDMNYDSVDEKICTVETRQYITNGQELSFSYCLIVEENEWKILSWENTAESEE